MVDQLDEEEQDAITRNPEEQAAQKARTSAYGTENALKLLGAGQAYKPYDYIQKSSHYDPAPSEEQQENG